MRPSLTNTAMDLANLQISVVPVNQDKRPVGLWGDAQQEPPNPAVIHQRFSDSRVTGIGAVCGKVSGGLLCFDFDPDKHGNVAEPLDLEADFVEPWLEAISEAVDPSLIPRQRTGSGGFQFFVKCPDPGGNTKLAKVPANNTQGFHVVIETRGEHGYALIPPSLHPSGNVYAWQHLDLTDAPTLTQDQADVLIAAARSLDQMPLEVPDERRLIDLYHHTYVSGAGDGVIQTFNERYHPTEILTRNGYTCVRGKYLAPSSTSGSPGVVAFKDAPLIYSHHGDALGDGKAHDTFGTFAILEHGGNRKAAFRAAAEELGLWRGDGSSYLKQGESPPEEPWEAKKPLPPTIPEVPNLPDAMLPEPFRDWIADAARRFSVHPEMIAIPALVSLGAVVGRTIGIHPKERDDWLEVPNLWGAIVAPPSAMKSPSIMEGTAPLDRLAAKATEAYEAAKAEREATEEVTKLQIEVLKKQARAKGGNPADFKDELQAKFAELEENDTPERRYLTNDGTVEKIAELLQENPRGLLVKRDELTGLLKTCDKPGHESDRAFYLEAWNGKGRHTIDRVGKGTFHISALTLSLVGGIQPGPLASYVRGAVEGEGSADGLLQRFQLLIWPDGQKPYVNVDRYPNRVAKAQAFGIFEFLDSLNPDILGATKDDDDPNSIPALRFDPEAQALFNTWYEAFMVRLRSPDLETTPAFHAHLSKYPSLMPSLALLFHLVDVAAGKPPGPVSVEAADLAAAWCDFLECHARKLYAPELNGAALNAHALSERIKQEEICDGQTVGDLYRHKWPGLKTADEVAAALRLLEEANWLRVQTIPNAGARPTKLIRLHPELRVG